MSNEKKTFGLVIKNKEKPPEKLPATSVFGDDEEEVEISQEKDAGKKFQMLYGSNKSRDQRAVAEALADDPDVYEYDSVYDEIEKQRNAKTEAQIEADKDKKPKYAHKIVESAKRREMELLMVKERQQQKEREAEGDEFKDKEVFVTGAYKKQIEEREKIRKELEESDRIDGRLKVEDQHMWQANFNRGLLDKLSRPGVTVVKKDESKEKKKSIYSDDEEIEPEVIPKKQFEELKPGLNLPTKTKKETENKSEAKRHRHDSDRRHRSSRHDRRSPERKGEKRKEEKPKDEKTILKERLKKVKEILKQRNDDSAVFMARQRYLQRKANGLIAPPTLA